MPAPPPPQEVIEQARKLLYAGRFSEAISVCERARRAHPGSATLMLIHGAALTRFGTPRKAIPLIRRVIERDPSRHQAHIELGSAHQADTDLEKAGDAFEKAVALAPDSPDAAAALGSLRRLQGDHEGAMAAVEGLVRDGKANGPCMLLFAEQARRLGRVREGIDAVRAYLRRDEVWPFYIRRLTWALGDLLDAAGEYDEAFACFTRVSETDRVRWNPDGYSAAVDAVIAAWTPDVIATLRESGVDTDLPVFIFGMPRSGSTLTEQIIASHPRACGGGELALPHKFAAQLLSDGGNEFALITDPGVLNRARLSRFGRSVAKRLSGLDRAAQRVTDKGLNACFHLGLIAAALPNARLVHCVRHPLDTCISCFSRDFRDKHAMAFTCDMTWLGRYYNDYRRMMAHWEGVLDAPIHRVEYERMVADQVGESKKLIDFVGLEWDDACERFHERKRVVRTASEFQVDQPIYTSSVRRYEKYAAHIGPLRAAIRPEYLDEAHA